MKPGKAANQLTKLWRSICPNESLYPVDCRLLAEALGANVVGAEIDDEFEAQLRIRGKVKAIIYNENIREEGRKNFCISHEIGHLSCHANREKFFCTTKDLNDMAPHPQNIEQEANYFAATLLMPADDFREQVSEKKVSLAFIGQLADERYQTSLTATARRLIDLSPRKRYGLATVRDGRVQSWSRTDEMKWTGFGFRKGHEIPKEALTCDPDGRPVDASAWLTAKNAPRWNLVQSSIYMPYYDQFLFLISANARDENFEQEEECLAPLGVPEF